jgi:hypothetical protein
MIIRSGQAHPNTHIAYYGLIYRAPLMKFFDDRFNDYNVENNTKLQTILHAPQYPFLILEIYIRPKKIFY